MNLNFYKIGVDSGTIMICDTSYYEKYGYKFEKELSKKRKIPNGKYYCFWHIPKTWNGSVEGDGILNVTTGEIIVSDPCYCIQNESDSKWMKFLDDTSYCNKPEEGTVILDKMGGDGEYSVYIRLDKIESKIQNQFTVSVQDDIYSKKLDLFLQENLKMELGSTGCGSTEFFSESKPENFENLIIQNFGKIVFDELQMFTSQVEE